MNLRDRAKELRDNIGFTQEDMSKMLGIEELYIHKFERGIYDINRNFTDYDMAYSYLCVFEKFCKRFEMFDVLPKKMQRELEFWTNGIRGLYQLLEEEYEND